MGPLPPNLVSVQPRAPSSRSAAAPAPATPLGSPSRCSTQKRRSVSASPQPEALPASLPRPLLVSEKPYSRTCTLVPPRVDANVSSPVVASAGSASHPSNTKRSGRFASMTFPHATASTDGGQARGPRNRRRRLVADAEQEQDDDQAERHAEEPEQDQDHVGPPSPLHPRGTVGHDRARAGRGPRLVVAEVHRLARAHPAAYDAPREPEQHRRGRGERTVAGGLRRVRIDRSARCGGGGPGRAAGDVPAAQHGAAEAREREQSDGGDEERDRSVKHRG